MVQMIESRFGIKLCEKTVANARAELGFKYRPPMHVQELTSDQKEQRFQFSQYAYSHFVNEKIVFSDESRFSLGPDNRWVYIKRGNWTESAMSTSSKFPLSVMFWGAIGKGYKSKLIVCSNCVDSKEYFSILIKSGLFQTCDMKYGKYGWCFMQDGAPSHTSKETENFLKEICRVIPGWPPNSPDLNPIEMIWSIIRKKLKTMKISTNNKFV